jgi:CRISPR/Cas system-associated exonuclease Cas4 (RecB family)
MPLLTIDDLLNGEKSEVETLIAQAAGISPLYERFVAEDQGDGHERAPGIHASEVSGCQRRLVYSILGEKKQEKIANVWKRRFKIGHAIHAMFQRDFHRMAGREDFRIEFEDEVKINPSVGLYNASKWDIHSSCDGVFVVKDLENNPLIRVVLEIKSESPDGYEKLKKPKPDHIEQAHVYMACLDVPLTWFLYYNKGNQNYTGSDNPSFFIRYDPAVWARLEQRFEAAHIAAVTKKLPNREEGVLCEFCPYSWTCQPPYLARKAGFHTPNPRWSKTP